MRDTPSFLSQLPMHPGEGVRVADRYALEELLGRGGMAVAYRARDLVTGQRVAVKLLSGDRDDVNFARTVELFEREFHTLVQLAHPRVVQAYDYGVHGGMPYYSMELLDGGDLQQLAPMPWQEICTIAYEICSALSLLHSRRLVHRDLTPRNIRRTADGKAKLMDFGLLSPMAPASLIAGTPPFVAPELMNRVSMDGRSDLFSLGATLYYALTGRPPFRARKFERLRDAWRTSPIPPSELVAGVPRALDDIILSMLRIDVGSRPKTAGEVMDRIRPLLGAPPDDELRVAGAYLTIPQLIGRDEIVGRFRKQMMRAVRRRGGGFVIAGAAGMGRSRMLDAFVLEAKLVGATAIRASASDGSVPFGVARALSLQLLSASPSALTAARKDRDVFTALFEREEDGDERAATRDAAMVAPKLVDLERADADRARLQAALRAWWLEFANQRPLAIAVDDVDRIDEPSAALLASLTWEASKHRLAYAVTLEADKTNIPSKALSILKERSPAIDVAPLDLEQTTRLLGSVFGDVPNLQLLGRRLHALCGGRPRDCMTLSQSLVERGAITYTDGSWTLPGEIDDDVLPSSIEAALMRQIARLSPLARRVAASLGLGIVERLSRATLLRLTDASAAALDTALDELLAIHLITGDTGGYALCDGSLGRLLTARLSEEEKTKIHADLARIHHRAGANGIVIAYHLLLGPRPDEGLDAIEARSKDSEARTELSINAALEVGAAKVAKTLVLALDQADRLGRSVRQKQALWVMLAGMSAQGEDAAYYYRVPPEWLDQLKHDSGWNDWHALDGSLDAATRVMTALGRAMERYQRTPEEDKVLSPPEAIKQLVSYVVFSIAVSARVLDLQLMSTLPPLLEPFEPLNPMVAAMLENARATLLNGLGRREEARERFLRVLDLLDAVSGAELAYVDKIRASLSQTLAEIDTSLGLDSVWIHRLEHEQTDPHQIVGARYLRKVLALQQGDWEGAEKHRQHAELLALQNKARPMFSTLAQELEAHAMARDLTGLRNVRTAIHAMADEHPGWVPVKHVADAHYLRLCGDIEGALSATELALSTYSASAPRSPWVSAAAAVRIELLAEADRAPEALLLGRAELEYCERNGMQYMARTLACALAVAEAKDGRFADAASRLESVIREQERSNVTGLQLGRSAELRARVALWAGDGAAFDRFAELAARQYRPGQSSVLGALYERLMEEAHRTGIGQAMAASPLSPADAGESASTYARVTTAMTGCDDRGERAQRALALLCDAEPALRGYLFVFTDQGLTLIADNTLSDSTAGLEEFVRDAVDLECAAGSMMTDALTPAETESLPRTHNWQARDGTQFLPLVLATTARGEYQIVGVAVLSDNGTGGLPASATSLAESLARRLLETGDARGIRAA